MSILVMTAVWEQSSAKGSDRLVLLYIADRCNDDGAGAYPSAQTIAKRCALSLSATRASLTRLKEMGELIIEPCAGPHGVNRYRVNLAALGTVDSPKHFAKGLQSLDPSKDKTPPKIGGGPLQRLDPPPPIFGPKPSIEPPIEPPPVKPPVVPQEKRAHQIPADFELTDERFNYAVGKGMDKQRIHDTFENFVLYWKSRGGTKKDWNATWQVWVLNEIKRYPRAPTSINGYRAKSGATSDDFFAYAQTLGDKL